MRLRRLELDLLRPDRPAWPGYALAVMALAFALDVGLSYRDRRLDVAALEARLARAAPARAAESAVGPRTSFGPEDLTLARETLRRLSLPWEELFAALESARSDRVALLAIEPDAESGAISISGEARDYLAALTYAERLAQAKGLRNVHLLRHEIRRDASQRTVTFTVSANWRQES